MKHTLFKFGFLSLSIIAFAAYAQTSASFSKSSLPSQTFINSLVGSYKIIDTDANGECPLEIDDEFIISYTTGKYRTISSVGMFVVDAQAKDTFYLGKDNLPVANASPLVWTGVESIVHENDDTLKRYKTEFYPTDSSWLKTVLTFDFSYAPGTYLEIRQNSSICNSFEDNLPVWNGGSSHKLPDSCEFVEDSNNNVPASFYCLAQKLNLDSLHSSQ